MLLPLMIEVCLLISVTIVEGHLDYLLFQLADCLVSKLELFSNDFKFHLALFV